MSTEIVGDSIRIIERSKLGEYREALARDVREGFAREQKELSPRYFYDERGSLIFEQICELPEYYQTRTERSILERIAPELARDGRFEVLAEFGSGSSSKTRVLLDALRDSQTLRRYVPIDVSREILLHTADQLVQEYPGMEVHAIIGDFNDGLPQSAVEFPCLALFLGGTIGNLREEEAIRFLQQTAGSMTDDDLFLLGVDQVKDPALLNAAYNDSAGVTAEFNLNVLAVINRELDADFDLEKFTHYSFYNPVERQIEMHLFSTEQQMVRIEKLDMDVQFERGETILTEISRKFTRRTLEQLFTLGGLELVAWYTDPDDLFALAAGKAR